MPGNKSRPESEKIRVLIVEDDYLHAEMLSDCLNLNGAFIVDWVETIRDFWCHFETDHHDLIILDNRLPDGTGIDAMQSLRDQGCDLPILMITGMGDENLAVKAMQLGASDYLMKGTNYLPTLPTLVLKAVKEHHIKLTYRQSLEQVRYQALLLNNVRDAVVVWNSDGVITYWNPPAERMFGMGDLDCVGKDVNEVYLDHFTPRAIPPTPESTNGHEIERRFEKQNGKPLWVSSRISALRDYGADGRLIGYIDVSRDITSRKIAEDALLAERNFVSAVLDTIGAMVVVMDRDGHVVRFNRACEEITGYDFKELAGKQIWDILLAPEEKGKVLEIFSHLQNGEFPGKVSYSWITKGGNRRIIDWSNTGLLGPSGEVKHIIATGIDMTEQIAAEQALRENETRYRMVSELVSDFAYAVICQPDHTLKIEWITDAFMHVTGHSLDEINLIEAWKEIIYPEDHETFLHFVRSLVEKKDQISEVRITTKDNEVRWLRIYAHPVIEATNQDVMMIYGAAKDITERKLMEARIRFTQLQLAESSRQAAIGDLASGVAHHINNPLTTIIAEAQILVNETPSDSNVFDSVKAIEQAGWRVQKAVQQLLEFSRPPTNTFEKLSINQTIKTALKLFDEQIKANGVQLLSTLARKLPKVSGNSQKLQSLWTNLLVLAKDGTNDGQPHTISIITRKEKNSILIEIRDDGKPIPEDEIENILEPNLFRSLGGRGSGIEINICQEIVRQHNGEFNVIYEPSQGAIFRVNIPLEAPHETI